MKKAAKRIPGILASIFLGALVFLFVWNRISEREDKDKIQNAGNEVSVSDEDNERTNPAVSREEKGISSMERFSMEETESKEPAQEMPAEISLIDPAGSTLEERIRVPDGYERTKEAEGSLGRFLRNYPLLPDGSPVLLYDGREKGHDSAVCVFDMHLGERDLQQCADSVIRMYAEYMRASGQEEKIAFHFVDGFLCDWKSYKSGRRISVNGERVSWKGGGAADDSDEAFERYLEIVFAYASTLSLEEESRQVELSDLKIGDIFIRGGSPGHVVMVVDTCEKDGKKAFLLAQGYMPAQQFHVLRNDMNEEDPWYYEDEVTYPFRTPEYTFDEGSLMRPGYLE